MEVKELMDTSEAEVLNRTQPGRKAAASWRTLPVQSELDRHEESAHAQLETPDGLTLIAARTRGRQHRHEGRNCDDWFELAQAGEWSLVAVADGAGGHPLSRVGAKAACQAAVAELGRQLTDVKTPSVFCSGNAGQPNIASAFGLEAYMRSLKAVYLAVEAACGALDAAWEERVERPEYRELLGRSPEPQDFSTTLSLLAFKVVQVDGERFALGWGYQIGDGLLAGVDSAGKAELVGVREQGEQANETVFLSRASLGRGVGERVRKLYLPLTALLAMTDGVIELPRFPLPNTAGVEMLYAEMVLNNVAPPPEASDAAIAAALSGTRYPEPARFMAEALFHHQVETDGKAAGRTLAFADSELLAECLGLELPAVLSSPALLAAGARRTALLCPASPSPGWLETWLSNFPWRGCYDDRTLVVAYEGAWR